MWCIVYIDILSDPSKQESGCQLYLYTYHTQIITVNSPGAVGAADATGTVGAAVGAAVAGAAVAAVAPSSLCNIKKLFFGSACCIAASLQSNLFACTIMTIFLLV